MRRDQLQINTTTYENMTHPWCGKTVYQVMIARSGTREAAPRISGCPLGRGLTEAAAYRDLRDGILAADGVDIGPLTEWSEAEVLSEVAAALEGYDRAVGDPDTALRDLGAGEDPAEAALRRIRAAHEALHEWQEGNRREAEARRLRLWSVGLQRRRIEWCAFIVEADSEEDARCRALTDEYVLGADWEDSGDTEGLCVTDVERMDK